jgi:hypothetical protein
MPSASVTMAKRMTLLANHDEQGRFGIVVDGSMRLVPKGHQEVFSIGGATGLVAKLRGISCTHSEGGYPRMLRHAPPGKVSTDISLQRIWSKCINAYVNNL